MFDVDDILSQCQAAMAESDSRHPLDRITGAIQVYGGDFMSQLRSRWGPGPLEERPYDLDLLEAQFAEADAPAGLSR
ncbi:MAG: hypothetical protein JWP02_3280 [Acidimicrobiales bacterium]|nr:hypothetical protein [Acidimicrobiales bacterium]